MTVVLEREQAVRAAPAPTHRLDRLAARLVVDLDVVLDPGLAGELEDQRLTGATYVPAFERDEPERVAVGIGIAPDQEAAEVEQPNGRGTRLVAGHLLVGEVLEHGGTHRR